MPPSKPQFEPIFLFKRLVLRLLLLLRPKRGEKFSPNFFHMRTKHENMVKRISRSPIWIMSKFY